MTVRDETAEMPGEQACRSGVSAGAIEVLMNHAG